MGMSSTFLCSRTRGRSGSALLASCDRPACPASIVITSPTEYQAAANDGWRKEPGTRVVRCPDHAGDLDRPAGDRHDPSCGTVTPTLESDACTCEQISRDTARAAAMAGRRG